MGLIKPVILISLLVLVVLAAAKKGGKNEQKNDLKAKTKLKMEVEAVPEKASQEPFRTAKLNAMWQKSQKRLSATDSRSLFEELKKLDKELVTLKRLQHDGGDKDGRLATELENDLRDIADRYTLYGEPSAKSKKGTTPKPKRVVEFKDKKLNKLWEKAQRSGFTEEELESLKEELKHHQQKLDEYNAEPEDAGIDAKIEEDADLESLNDLDADYSKYERERKLSKVDKKKFEAVDDKLKDLTKSYSSLKAKVMRTENLRDSELDFREQRVEELWNQALQSGFTRDELNSLRDELRHFEKKLTKLKYLNEEVKNLNDNLTKKVLATAEESAADDIKQMQSKLKDMAHKVDIAEKDLEKRILTRHNEL